MPTFTMDCAPDDLRPPAEGDYVATARTGYRVTEVRPVESRLWPNRWRLTVVKIGSADLARLAARNDGTFLHESGTYQGVPVREWWAAHGYPEPEQQYDDARSV